jgi:hypothetical protein
MEQEDYTEFMKEEQRFEESMRFDMSKMENLKKIQLIQQQIKSANRQRGEDKQIMQ